MEIDSKRYGRKAIQADKTWSGLLLNEDNLPDNWVRQSGVLVSMVPRRPPGRKK
ncbi:uncharacterized protein HD556DRAFT_1367679 [Suillus plorans]|uniref:Uncharacterized protein n=1 Tax=Suillus plorans TaxID=116603 RepID=A0A9P7AT33_9AGAM|nr:uncharacterized protein HD556DRAFT_1367679 [Suillus plorans]KAG1794878.1 hypothetical protein HD556DRAFT_1367679 [Suillus plorans]